MVPRLSWALHAQSKAVSASPWNARKHVATTTPLARAQTNLAPYWREKHKLKSPRWRTLLAYSGTGSPLLYFVDCATAIVTSVSTTTAVCQARRADIVKIEVCAANRKEDAIAASRT